MAMVFAYTQVDDTYLEQIRVGVFFEYELVRLKIAA